MGADISTTGLQLRSLVKEDGTVELSLIRVDAPEPAPLLARNGRGVRVSPAAEAGLGRSREHTLGHVHRQGLSQDSEPRTTANLLL